VSTWFYTVESPTDSPGAIGQRTPSQYARVMRHLLPPGRLWNFDPAGYLMRVFLAAGDELSRVSGRVLDLLAEADPRTATDAELLGDFERLLTLDGTGTESERQNRVVARLTQDRGFRPQDVRETLAPLLDQDVVDVVIIERTTIAAAVIAEPREIYRYFVYRDPLAAGTADLEGAQAALDSLEHTHTKGHVIESLDFKCDEATSLCDRDALGA
jgi:hypothetical protein